ncbi:helix-turn-helix domain-containing protein [Streptomyces sp. MUSC 14]|uniref:helix-turn-helix domain-containing protein n=1 Tax=Streptomyces sp. MUSC 14 TaxID=1354889 RepID=UPI0011600C6A|nr:helix-turn-helix domain-containing protein [Streptomyces sp. MUSC 14]
MSIGALSWGFKQEIRVPGAKLVLLALCDFADESWSCFPGQETLAAKTSQSERTVRRHLDWLEGQGFIVSSARFAHGRRTSNRYTIHTPRSSTPSSPPAAEPAETGGQPEADGHDTDAAGEADQPNPVHPGRHVHPGSRAAHPRLLDHAPPGNRRLTPHPHPRAPALDPRHPTARPLPPQHA